MRDERRLRKQARGHVGVQFPGREGDSQTGTVRWGPGVRTQYRQRCVQVGAAEIDRRFQILPVVEIGPEVDVAAAQRFLGAFGRVDPFERHFRAPGGLGQNVDGEFVRFAPGLGTEAPRLVDEAGAEHAHVEPVVPPGCCDDDSRHSESEQYTTLCSEQELHRLTAIHHIGRRHRPMNFPLGFVAAGYQRLDAHWVRSLLAVSDKSWVTVTWELSGLVVEADLAEGQAEFSPAGALFLQYGGDLQVDAHWLRSV